MTVSLTPSLSRRARGIGSAVRATFAIMIDEEGMNLKQIEYEALNLLEEERAELAQKLLLSLDMPTIEEMEDDWLFEARRRARELDEGIVQPIPAEEVRKRARALLR